MKITKKIPSTPVYLDERSRNPVSELNFIEFEKFATGRHPRGSKCRHRMDNHDIYIYIRFVFISYDTLKLQSRVLYICTHIEHTAHSFKIFQQSSHTYTIPRIRNYSFLPFFFFFEITNILNNGSIHQSIFCVKPSR